MSRMGNIFGIVGVIQIQIRDQILEIGVQGLGFNLH